MIRVVRIGTPRARGEGVRLGTVRLLPRGVKKEEIKRLFSNCQFAFSRITLMPPAARVLGRLSVALCEMLSSFKVCTTHYLVIITKVSPSLMVVRSSKY